MRIVVLGGSGRAGRRACRTLDTTGRATEIIVAARDVERAELVAAGLTTPASAVSFELTDPTSRIEAVDGADVVLNAVAPFFRHGTAALDATIEVGAHYFDICDDWEPSLAMLERDGRAAARGVVAVTGLGLAPGVDSVLATRATRELDEVLEIVTAWSLQTGSEMGDDALADDAPAPGRVDDTLVHLMHCCSGTIRLVRGGRRVDLRPLEPVEIDLPNLGRVTGWTVGSPEALTLAAGRTTVATSVNLMIAPTGVIDALRALRDAIEAGDLTVDAAAQLLTGGPDEDLVTPTAESGLPPLFAAVSGTVDSCRTTVLATPGSLPPGSFTGAGVALGLAPMLYLDDLPRPGVHSVEAVTDPERYLTALAAHGGRGGAPDHCLEVVVAPSDQLIVDVTSDLD